METPPAYFELRDVRKSFGRREILRGASLSVPAGKITVILGGSGAGKSVLLKHFNGLLRPDSGKILVEGEEIQGMSERKLVPIRRRIGILFQNGALFDSMSVAENVAFPLRETGERDRHQIHRRVSESLAMVELAGEEEKMPAALSGGMRKRVALARALINRPDCLLYDEPTAGLDPILASNISSLIRRLQDEIQPTSVVVTHNLAMMRQIADHVVFVKQGAVRFSGSFAELESSPDPEIQTFLKTGFEFGE